MIRLWLKLFLSIWLVAFLCLEISRALGSLGLHR